MASLLAQSRAVGSKPLTTQQLLSQGADLEKIRLAIEQNNLELQSNTDDSESINDSAVSESEGDSEEYNVNELRTPLEKGWRRETIIRGLTKSGQIKGEVYYFAPGTQIKLVGIEQVEQALEMLKR